MAYCTKADLLQNLDEEILRQLTDDDTTGVVNDEIVSGAIDDADAEIEGYCSGYTLPFNPVPRLIKKISVDITLHNLFGRRHNEPKEVSDQYTKDIKILENITRGLVKIGKESPSDRSGSVKISANDPVFNQDTLKGY
jgi:phage gp36-like protein